MMRRSTLIAAEIVLGLVAALVIGLGVAWWRLSQGPLELNSIREHVQAELSAARSGRPVSIDRVELAWNAESNTLDLRALGVVVKDGAGALLSRSDEARIELDVLPLLIGRVSLKRAEFSGGAVTVTRKRDGAVSIAFGPPGAPADITIPPPPPEETLEQRVARVLDAMSAAFRPVGAGGSLSGLSVRNARLAILDEGGGGAWTADSANIDLSRQRRSLRLSASALVEGADGSAPASLRIETDTHFRSAVIEFGAENARPRALFSPAALGAFAGLDAPVTASVSIALDRERGVSRFEGDVAIGRGSAQTPAGRFSLEGGRFHGRYDIESDELIIDALDLAGERTRVDGEVRVRNVSAIVRATPNQPAAFDISLPSLRLDVPGAFSAPIALTNVRVVGAINSSEREVRLAQVQAQSAQAVLHARGRLYWAASGADGAVRPGVDLEGRVDGALDAPAVMRFWPIGVGEAARDYLTRSITSGQVTDAIVRLDLRPSDFVAEAFRNEAIDVRFNVTDGAMRFIETMSPVTGVRGAAVLRGNRFDLSVESARINGLRVTGGSVEIPRFKPKGALATIAGRAEGDTRNVVELLTQEPLRLGDRLPVDVASVQGRSSISLRLQRPMLRDVPFEQWRFRVDGTLSDFGGVMSTRQVALSQGQLTVRGDERAITVSGPIRAGESSIDRVRWTENIGGGARAASSEYQISGDFDANDLERLGYPVARFAQGRVGVTVTGRGRGFDVDNARIEIDLGRAAVEAPWAFWTKRAGQAGSVSFAVQRQADGGLVFANIDARGQGLSAQGGARLAADNRIMAVNLTQLVVEGRSNARIGVARAGDGGLDVSVAGALFDASPFMDTATPPAAGADGGGGAAQPPLRARIAVDRLKMRGGVTLSNARVELDVQRGELVRLVTEGRTPGDAGFNLALGEPRGQLRFQSGDAGFAVTALTGAENVVGGTASARGDWRTGPPSQARFSVEMRDFEVVRLPAMARLLSSAGSLTGLVEMLNGDGIGFDRLDAQMVYANERLTFSEGRMSGPSLGLTGAGSYNMERDDLDIDGVVAPSPRLNLSMLGEIPVLGNLIVSRRGEGVFGMTYAINGPAGSPRVGVNPVSALTPGILRRIFEPLPQREASAPVAAQAEQSNGASAQAAPAAPP